MPFPLYSHSTVSTFTGDESPLSEGGIWAQMTDWPGVAARKTSGQMAQASGGDTYWTAILDDRTLTDFEYVFDVPTFDMSLQVIDIMWRLQDPTDYDVRDCYLMYTTTDGNTALRKLIDNAESSLDTDTGGTSTWQSGDKVGVQSIGTSQSVWRFRSSTWTEIVSGTDAAYSSGKIALGGYGATMRLDNLTIGTPAAAGTGRMLLLGAG
jgi:hypothetical protein